MPKKFESYSKLGNQLFDLFEDAPLPDRLILNQGKPYYEFKGTVVAWDTDYNTNTISISKIETNPKINIKSSDTPKKMLSEYLLSLPDRYNLNFSFIESSEPVPKSIPLEQIDYLIERQYLTTKPVDEGIFIDAVLYKDNIKIPDTSYLRDYNAPFQSNFSIKQSWNVTKDNCCIDYLVAKLNIPRDSIPIQKDGCPLEEFIAYLETRCNYYICNPFLIITHKYYNDNFKRSVYLMINNSHIYPIENAEVQEQFHHKHLGDKLISVTGIPVYTEDINKIIESKLPNMLPSFVEIQNNAIKSATYDDSTYVQTEDIKRNQTFANDFSIEYTGQTTSKLAFDIINTYKKLPPPCVFTKLNYDKFMQKQIRPTTRYFSENQENCTALDINRFYTSLLYQSEHEWPLLDSYAQFEPLNQTYPLALGFYRITKFIDDYLFIEKGTLVASCLANYLLENQMITLADISEQCLATRKMPANYFKETIEYFYKTESPFLKSLFNYFIGMTGTVKSTKSAGFLTSDLQTALYYYGKGYDFKTYNGYYQVYYHAKANKHINYRPIHAQVMNLSFIYMHKLIKSINAEIVAIKTDCLILRNYTKQHPSKSASLASVGKVCTEAVKFNPRNCNINNDYIDINRVWNEVTEIEPNCLITGAAGTGKTTLIKAYLTNNNSYLITSMSHMALSNYEKNKCVMQKLINMVLRRELPRIKTLVVDEYTMLNKDALNVLYSIKLMGCDIILVGDAKQAYGIDSSPISRDNQIYGELTDWNILKLTKQHRSDPALLKFQTEFDETSMIPTIQPHTQITADYLHLCYTNKKVDAINKLLKGKTITINKKEYLPYISTSNAKLFNNQRIYKRKNKYYDLDLNEITLSPKDKIKPCYAITIHKAQGQTIMQKVLIHEANKLTKDLMYVAITRVRTLDNLFFSSQPTKFFEYPKIVHECPTVANHKYGLIYKFYKDKELVDIGYCENDHEFERIKHEQDEPYDRCETKKYSYNTIEDLMRIVKQQIPKAKPPKAVELEYFRYSILEEKEYVTVYDNEKKERVKRFKIGKKTVEECKQLAKLYIEELQ